MKGDRDEYTRCRGAILLFFLVLLLPVSAWCVELSVRAAVEKQEVYVGESFLLQIQIEGDDSPEEPDLSTITDFHVQKRGGQQNSSTSITIINGKMDQVVRRGYIYNFNLTPKKEGVLQIPSIKVTADGNVLQTEPISIYTKKPQETEDFKLSLQLSKNTFYVGEPVELIATWYLAKDVKEIGFNLPLLDDPRFILANPDDSGSGRQNAVRIPLDGREVLGLRGEGVLDGRRYMTLRFKQVLIAKQAGEFVLPQATLSCKALTGYRRDRRHDMFGDIFGNDFFGRGRQGVYATVITPSNELNISVAPLPEKGKPAGFSGLVGEFSITANAVPTEVNVGDPITLSIQVAGPYVKKVELPPLHSRPGIAENFKIPDEMAPGEINGMIKTFTQTIRAKHPDVKEVPVIQLDFFNPKTGHYETVHSHSIPLNVRATRIVTAEDAMGRELLPQKKDIEGSTEGIAYNYEGSDVIENQEMLASGFAAGTAQFVSLVLPPALFVVLLSGVGLVRRRDKDSAGLRARKAHANFLNAMKTLQKVPISESTSLSAKIADALRQYLGDKVNLPAGALTYQDVESPLARRGVSPQVLATLKSVFQDCEAMQYAGNGTNPADFGSILKRARDIVSQLEKTM